MKLSHLAAIAVMPPQKSRNPRFFIVDPVDPFQALPCVREDWHLPGPAAKKLTWAQNEGYSMDNGFSEIKI